MESHYIITVTVRGATRYLHVDHNMRLRIVENRSQATGFGHRLIPIYKELTSMRFNVGSVDHEEV